MPNATTSTKPVKPTLSFRYLKNCMIDLGDGAAHTIPSKLVVKEALGISGARVERNPVTGRLESKADAILVPEFDCGPGSHIHHIVLADERPRIPKKQPGQSEKHHQRLVDLAIDAATSAKAGNDAVRRKAYHYASPEQAVIEIINDPFTDDYEIVVGIEQIEESAAAAIQVEQEVEAPVKPTN